MEQHNLTVKQRDHGPKSRTGDQGEAGLGAAERIVVIQEVGGDCFGGCGDCVVVVVQDAFRVR